MYMPTVMLTSPVAVPLVVTTVIVTSVDNGLEIITANTNDS